MQQTYFSKKEDLRSYNIKEISFPINIRQGVFPPSVWAEKVMECLEVEKNDKVIDIGTGAGVIGIYAALLGADAYGTDTSADAIIQAKENATLNKVSMECGIGSYFCDFQTKFDIIAANLPQEIIPTKYDLNPDLLTTIKGGTKGNELVLGLLEEAPKYMNNDTKLIMPVCSLSFYLETLKYMEENFSVKIRKVFEVEAKEYVFNYEEFYKTLNNEGHIRIFKRANKWYHLLYIVELQKK